MAGKLSPEGRAAIAAKQKAAWADPERRAKRIAAMKAKREAKKQGNA